MLTKCTKLILPLLNEIFGEHYTGDEEIVLAPNELFMPKQEGKDEKRITDSTFKVISKYGEKKYLCECQSNPDSSMLIRIYEYAVQIALQEKKFVDNKLKVSIPHCAVLFLRSTKSTPDKMTVEIETPKGAVEFDVEVMKIQKYSLEELFEKRLLFLLPYYIFTHESQLKEYNEDMEKLIDLQAECYKITEQLEELIEQKEIDSYIKGLIMQLYNTVTAKIASKYDNVVEGVNTVMGGKILECAVDKSRAEGEKLAKRENAKALLDLLDDETIAERIGLTIEEVRALREEN